MDAPQNHLKPMPRNRKPGLLPQLLESSVRAGFRRAYEQVQVDPARYLVQLRRTYRLPIQSWDEMLRLGEETLNPIAARVIKGATRTAALEGTGHRGDTESFGHYE